ncbi:MAG: hypothetical protein NC200_08305, partial [Candidatus Gastranaerophilales bacterium]|nr:hypothetical protein [Candidatus Gastranaerophilales bacterium]
MQNYNTINNNVSFGANLKLSGKKFAPYKKKNNIDKTQIEELKDKFEKATKDTNGTLELDFGSKDRYGTIMSRIRYVNENKEDSIKVLLENEKLSADDKFVGKLVKMLDIFKMRENNFQKIEKLNIKKSNETDIQKHEKLRERIYRLSRKAGEDSRKATRELFDLPYS